MAWRLSVKNPSSHSVASISRWFDGSSSSMTSGLPQQQLGEQQAIVLSAAEWLDGLSKAFRRKAEAVEHPFDVMVDVVGVAMRSHAAGDRNARPAVGARRGRPRHSRRGRPASASRRQAINSARPVGPLPRGCVREQSSAVAPSIRAGPKSAVRPFRRRGLTAGQNRQQRRLSAPLGPTSPIFSPGRTSNETPSRIGSGPKCLVTSVMERTIMRGGESCQLSLV